MTIYKKYRAGQDEEKTLYLDWKESDHGLVLCVVDETGRTVHAGSLLRFDFKTNSFIRLSGVDKKLDICLCDEGRIAIIDG